MNFFDRRSYLKHFVGFFGVTLAGTSKINVFSYLASQFGTKNFEVIYHCNKTSQGSDYLSNRHMWGNVDEIVKISQKYFSSKDLLLHKRYEQDNRLYWVYIFKNEESFNRWNDEIFYSGTFNSLKISEEFSFSVSKRYIAPIA